MNMVFLGCLTFHCYGGSEKRLLLEVHLSDTCVSFLWIMIVQFKWPLWQVSGFNDYERLKMQFFWGGGLLHTDKHLLFHILWSHTLLKLRVTKGCNLRAWGEKMEPNGTPGGYTDVEMRVGCFTGGFKRIKVLLVSNRRKLGTSDFFQLPWLTITWPVARVP